MTFREGAVCDETHSHKKEDCVSIAAGYDGPGAPISRRQAEIVSHLNAGQGNTLPDKLTN